MSLINESQIAQIKAALQAVTDTFFEESVTYRQRNEPFAMFNNSRDSSPVDHPIKGLVLFNGDPDRGQADNRDEGELIIVFNMDDLAAASLLDNNRLPVFKRNQDTMLVFGDEFEIEDVIPVGPLAGYRVCKVVLRKNLEK